MSSHNDSFTASGTSPSEQVGSDFFVENHGSVFLLRPVTPAASDWISEHIPDDAQFFGDAIVVEHRYIWAILAGLQEDGLVVTRG